jgi:hypothetical protein
MTTKAQNLIKIAKWKEEFVKYFRYKLARLLERDMSTHFGAYTLGGAMTFSIMTLSITASNIMTFSVTIIKS